MLSIEQIYIQALKTKMGEWDQHYTTDKVKELMQDLMFKETLYSKITRTTMLTCMDSGDEHELLERLQEVIGSIYQLMLLTGEEINATDAWQYMENSVTYEGDSVGYHVGTAKKEKTQKEARERAAFGHQDDTFMGMGFPRGQQQIDSRNLLGRMQSL